MGVTALRALADKVLSIGFRCTRCGDCCRGLGNDGSLVMAGRDEVERISRMLGRPLQEVAEPYPETVEIQGARVRLGWALLRDEAGACRQYNGNRCSVYADRPHLCRTYPFMLDGDRLIVSECPGIGAPLTDEEALAIARDLLLRQGAEEEDAREIQGRIATAALSSGADVVIDSWGVTPL